MVTRESPDVFTICIAGIEPEMDVKVETRYVQLAAPEGIGWSIRVPLTTAPRYIRKDEFSSRHAHGQPLAVLRDPGHRFAMDLKILGASCVESPTHRLSMAREGDSIIVRLQEGEVVPDRDCMLVWKPKQEGARPMLKAMAHEDASGDTYFMAMLAPPASKDVKKISGEYVILIDHSGSMAGPKKEAAEWAVGKFLLGLGPDDWFTLGAFSNNTRWYSRLLAGATGDTVKNAVEFMKSKFEGGGTEMGVALEQALDIKRLKGDVSRHVLIITDAEVTDGGRILRLVDRESRRPDRRSISLLCIDAAPNSYLAAAIAERGGGIVKFLTSDPSEGDISSALDAILDDWRQPLLAGLRLTVDRPGLDSTSGTVHPVTDGSRYLDIGDLPAGRTIWASGKVTGSIGEGMTIRVLNRAGATISTHSITKADVMPEVKPLFGAKKLLGLEYLIHSRYTGTALRSELETLGYDPEKVFDRPPKLYPENSQVNEIEALRDFIVKESLGYGLPSSETALIAVYHRAGKRVEATALVPNALPEGWDQSFESADILSCAPIPKQAPSASFKLMSPARKASKFAMPDMVYHLNHSSSVIEDIDDESFPIPRNAEVIVYSGTAAFTNGEAVLFDSALSPKKLSGADTLHRLKVEFSGKKPASLDPGLSILIFVEDLTVPVAKVKLADLLRQRGVRPLNISIAGARVRVVLSDPAGVWAKSAMKLEISLGF
ncbi:conserved hypothetical protein [Methanocella paludicola SANAE]|uniref:VWFA domain-containing protein n=1 Tax=Methanocella paludicola (strain DSM 17711 / JCM 13418 / NBRC 101707 / SANAE) TaxID=304371 RepID=D1YYY2_METPS|nr:conserved hypothetical protein [Methanocella paludicola SANAE]